MPRDLIETETDPKPDLTKPSLKALEWVLRHREAWPPDYLWDFGDALVYRACGSAGCAVGIATLLWREGTLYPWQFQAWWHPVFAKGADHVADKITPEVVAGRIRDVLAGRKVRFIKGVD